MTRMYPMVMRPMIDIVIISYSGGELLEKAVKSLVTIPIDTEINIIVQQEKQSIPKNVNAGFEQVKSDWFVLFNDDWEAIQENWLDNLLVHAEPKSNIGFISCRVRFDNGLLNHRGYKISSNGIVGNLGRNEPDAVLEDTPHPLCTSYPLSTVRRSESLAGMTTRSGARSLRI